MVAIKDQRRSNGIESKGIVPLASGQWFAQGSQTLSAKNAAALDKELMTSGAFSIDQLMELAGLSVSQAGMP